MRRTFGPAAILALPVMLSGTLFADFTFVKDGKSCCTIVVKKDAHVVEKHAAAELSKFLGKISAGEKPVIAEKPLPGTKAVKFALTKDDRLKDEGFMVRTTKDTVTFCGKEEIGFLYGVYELLKKYTGIRWLVPGDDGEYFTVQKTISVPEGEWISNPDFFFRNINWCCATYNSPKWDSFDWMVRNRLRIFSLPHDKSIREGLLKRAYIIQAGGHCFNLLLAGYGLDGKPREAVKKEFLKMYKDHPEYFPLINGKRRFLEGEEYQPCTSNPEVVRIMAENLVRNLRQHCSKTPGGRYRLVNNDGTGWCQCENCRKQDLGSNMLSNRYWTFMNQLIAYVKEKEPNAILNTIAYQNFQEVPTDVLPDRRFATMELSFNRICYRHRLDDPNCPTNRDYFRKHKDWQKLSQKLGIPLVTYGQIDALGMRFMPIEDVYPDFMRLYYKLGVRGIRPQIPPVDGRYAKHYELRPMVRNCWYGMWQTLYLFAEQSWDIRTDTDKLLEEINTLYYGKAAWEAGMKDFRKLLCKAFHETPGCFGHGSQNPPGRCLDKAGVHEKLLSHLDAAEKAAAKDPDKRALKHVQRERWIFGLTWEKFRREYLANYRELRSYRRTSPVKIDGVLDEPDWGKADTISDFKLVYGKGPAKQQTYVRVFHEPEYIYFGVECMEPDVDKLREDTKEDHDGKVWNDNAVEFFLNHPDLSSAYYQIIVSSAGKVFDHFVVPGGKSNVKFDSGIEVATRKLKDRWILEARIPTAHVGEKCFDGQSWKVNVMRVRRVKGLEPGQGIPVEASTWSMGAPHDVGTFLPVYFLEKRIANLDGTEKDTRLWRNGSFDELDKRKNTSERRFFKDGKKPAYWHFCGKDPSGSLESLPDDPKAHYMRMRGIIANEYFGKGEKAKVRFRVRGEGRISLAWYCYDVKEKGKRVYRDTRYFYEKDISEKEWKSVTLEVPRPQYDLVKFAAHLKPKDKNSFMDLDEVYITPSSK
ncbi:MAG: DUF4838 domain-containing protein [Lentisphaeria bacterium]|nr:DUF4838 domain-containing protein [Lentisphaeria bacterium]